MNVLDLCCGLGGFSAAWRQAGHLVTTLDSDPRLHPDVCCDVRSWQSVGIYDVILAAPPCTEYSRRDQPWTREAALDPDLSIWTACERIISQINPSFFVIENVRGAIPYHGPARQSAGARFFWGSFPLLALPAPGGKSDGHSARWVRDLVPDSTYAERRYWSRSYIEYEVSKAIMDSILIQPSLDL